MTISKHHRLARIRAAHRRYLGYDTRADVIAHAGSPDIDATAAGDLHDACADDEARAIVAGSIRAIDAGRL